MSLQTEYRPKNFKTFFGNQDVILSLRQILKRDKNPPAAFMFTGPGGTGKTTMGRIIARALRCKKADFKEVNGSNDRSIKGVRALIESMKFAPLAGEKKVILIDEAHMLTNEAQEALLKALEEPPEYVHWILCTTNPEKLKPTLKRRCHIYELELLKSNETHKLLKSILEKEKVKKFPQTIMDKIVDLADGSAGLALKYLDMVIDMEDEERALNTLKSAGTSESEVIDICRALLQFEMPPRTRWLKCKKLLKAFKGDAESARRPILGYLSKALIGNNPDDINGQIFLMMGEFNNHFYDSGTAGLIGACYGACYGSEDQNQTDDVPF